MGRKVVLAVDDSPHSRVMVDTAIQFALHKGTDHLHLVTVLPPITTAMAMAPVASPAAMSAVQHSAAVQRHADEEKATAMLRMVQDLLCLDYKVPKENLHLHVLPSIGGASGVSDAVVEFAKQIKAGAIVVGSRGMGSVKRALMPLIGLGSVSDAVLRGAPCAVLLVKCDPAKLPRHGVEAEPAPASPVTKRVCLAYDDSPASKAALIWCLDNILNTHDQLHIAAVSLSAPLLMLDEPVAAAAMQSREADQDAEAAAEYASRLVDVAAEEAIRRGVTHTKITRVVLKPSGGPCDAGHAITSYTNSKEIDVLVVGSRGMGAVQRSVMGFLGLGSVSEYLAHHVHCMLAAVHGEESSSLTDRGGSLKFGDSIHFHAIPEQAEEADSGNAS